MGTINVLTITNLYPTRRSPHGGIFIDRRIAAQRKGGVDGTLVDIGYRVLGIPRGSVRTKPANLGKVESVKVNVSPADWGRFRKNDPERRTLRRYATKLSQSLNQPPDLIHAHGMYGPHAGTIARELSSILGVPYVVTLHGSDINDLTPTNARPVVETLQNAAACIFVSSALRSQAYSLGLERRAAHHVIPNGVDSSTYGELNRRRPPSSADPKLLYVGNLFPVKGADRLPQIFADFSSKFPSAVLEIIGHGPLRKTLESALPTDSVTFLGIQPAAAVADAMGRASMLVVPSRNEGWPNVILEAYAAGTPVVATDVGGSAEAMGGLGIAVASDPWSPKSFSSACIETLRSPPDAKVLQEYASSHSWENLAELERQVFMAVQRKDSNE